MCKKIVISFHNDYICYVTIAIVLYYETELVIICVSHLGL